MLYGDDDSASVDCAAALAAIIQSRVETTIRFVDADLIVRFFPFGWCAHAGLSRPDAGQGTTTVICKGSGAALVFVEVKIDHVRLLIGLDAGVTRRAAAFRFYLPAHFAGAVF